MSSMLFFMRLIVSAAKLIFKRYWKKMSQNYLLIYFFLWMENDSWKDLYKKVFETIFPSLKLYTAKPFLLWFNFLYLLFLITKGFCTPTQLNSGTLIINELSPLISRALITSTCMQLPFPVFFWYLSSSSTGAEGRLHNIGWKSIINIYFSGVQTYRRRRNSKPEEIINGLSLATKRNLFS